MNSTETHVQWCWASHAAPREPGNRTRRPAGPRGVGGKVGWAGEREQHYGALPLAAWPCALAPRPCPLALPLMLASHVTGLALPTPSPRKTENPLKYQRNSHKALNNTQDMLRLTMHTSFYQYCVGLLRYRLRSTWRKFKF